MTVSLPPTADPNDPAVREFADACSAYDRRHASTLAGSAGGALLDAAEFVLGPDRVPSFLRDPHLALAGMSPLTAVRQGRIAAVYALAESMRPQRGRGPVLR